MERIETKEEYEMVVSQLTQHILDANDDIREDDPLYIEVNRLGDLIDEYDTRFPI